MSSQHRTLAAYPCFLSVCFAKLVACRSCCLLQHRAGGHCSSTRRTAVAPRTRRRQRIARDALLHGLDHNRCLGCSSTLVRRLHRQEHYRRAAVRHSPRCGASAEHVCLGGPRAAAGGAGSPRLVARSTGRSRLVLRSRARWATVRRRHPCQRWHRVRVVCCALRLGVGRALYLPCDVR